MPLFVLAIFFKPIYKCYPSFTPFLFLFLNIGIKHLRNRPRSVKRQQAANKILWEFTLSTKQKEGRDVVSGAS